MIDLPTLEGWIRGLGYAPTAVDASTLRLHPPKDGPELPPFYVEWTPNWVVLSMLPILSPAEYRAEDLCRRLLAANRDMRLAKFALDAQHAVVLSAELPTESLDFSEVEAAVDRMVEYARGIREELLGVP